MTTSIDVDDVVSVLAEGDARYSVAAYVFVLAALDVVHRRQGRRARVGARDLVLATRDYARVRFGSLAPTVFRAWGLRETVDFGHIARRLVDVELFSLREEDTIDSFRDVYDFDEEFVRRYHVSGRRS